VTDNTADAAAPDTIVLVHGFWVTPRSWEKWVERYESRGYRVLAPAYPGLEVEVEALNEDPSPIEALTVPAIVEHYEGIIDENQPGFVSANIHSSLDGTRVTNYAQWRSTEAFETMLQNQEAAEHMGEAARIAQRFEPHLYEVSFVDEV
jgi:Antibiotic biosynthesis monooxygenase